MTLPPDRPPPAARRTVQEARALAVLLVLVTVALGWILGPLFGAILWSAVIALLFAPVQRWLVRRLRRRHTLAALLTLSLATAVVILPLSLVSAALTAQAAALYQRVRSGELNLALVFRTVYDALPEGLTRLLGSFGMADLGALQQRLTQWLGQASQAIASRAFDLGQGTFEFGALLLITLYLAFFMIRDGEQLVRAVRRALPLADSDMRLLGAKFANVIRATMRGNLLVALLQGALGGLAFWVLGVGGALLWAVLMALLSLLPAVGAALVWAPVVVYFIATGEPGKALALTAWGVGVIGLIDNLLRPLLVGRETGLSDALVLVTTLGGIAAFGLNGFILGPAIAAMFIAAWHLYAPGQRQG